MVYDFPQVTTTYRDSFGYWKRYVASSFLFEAELCRNVRFATSLYGRLSQLWTQQMSDEQSHKVHLSPEDQERLRELRAQKPARNVPKLALTPGAMLADRVAEIVGSWRFIVIQSVLLGIWIMLNMIAFINHWDPYPFILLNLVLSFQAAYAAPIIMMSQNRQSEIDRRHAEHDYRINVKAELEIELLHNKIDALREQEILQLLNIIQRLAAHLAPELVAAIEAETVPGKTR